MELRWKNNTTSDIGVAIVSDSDAKVMRAMGYEHCDEEDFMDDDYDGAYVEVWKPVRVMGYGRFNKED